MFNTGDRVSRDYMNEPIGNVTYADKSARVAHVVFDNHKDGTPTLCTFESLKHITEPESEAPAVESYNVVKRFAELKAEEKERGHATRSPGLSVAALVDESREPKIVYGLVTHFVYRSNDSRVTLITREGDMWNVTLANVVAV